MFNYQQAQEAQAELMRQGFHAVMQHSIRGWIVAVHGYSKPKPIIPEIFFPTKPFIGDLEVSP